MKPWISKKSVQSLKVSFVEKPTHRRQLVKLIACLEKIKLAIAQYRFSLQNFVLRISSLKMNHVEDPNPK